MWGYKRVTNTPEITPGDGEITSGMRICGRSYCRHQHPQCWRDVHETRMTRRGKEIGTLDDALSLARSGRDLDWVSRKIRKSRFLSIDRKERRLEL